MCLLRKELRVSERSDARYERRNGELFVFVEVPKEYVNGTTKSSMASGEIEI